MLHFGSELAAQTRLRSHRAKPNVTDIVKTLPSNGGELYRTVLSVFVAISMESFDKNVLTIKGRKGSFYSSLHLGNPCHR